MLSVVSPFKTRPVYVMLLVSSLSVCLVFQLATFFSLSLSFSGAGETQTPSRGFGVPFVFFSQWTPSPTSIRTSSPSPTPRPAPVFFSFVGVACFSGSGVFRFVLVVLGFLVVCVTERAALPPTPFLPNAVKDSQGKGWGRLPHGNRTVTSCLVMVPCKGKGS